jgi:site-specific recombinase XerD
MTALAPALEAFFTERLARQRNASPNTVAAYRDTFCLLLRFAQQRTGKLPTSLSLQDLDAPLVGAFLDYLEAERAVSVATRNARLACLHSFFRFASLRHPDNAALVQRVLAIPAKRTGRTMVSYLDKAEAEALLAAPDLSTRTGRRDRALLAVALQTGLRVSELAGLGFQDVRLGQGAHVHCTGKGRKERCTPLSTQTSALLRAWAHEVGGGPGDPVFPGPGGKALSRDAIAKLVARHAASAGKLCPSITAKKVGPHTLRHSCAMRLLEAGVDVAVIALWLGHESVRTTDIYQHANLALKERALDKTAQPHAVRGRYKPPDSLLAFLESL